MSRAIARVGWTRKKKSLRASERDEATRAAEFGDVPIGAVVVKGDRTIGEGFHTRAGEPHAERVAPCAHLVLVRAEQLG